MSLQEEREAREEVKKFLKSKEAEKILDLTKKLRTPNSDDPEMETPEDALLRLGIASNKKETSSSTSKKDPRKIIGIHYGGPGDEPYPIYEGEDNDPNNNAASELDDLLPSYDSLPPSRVGFMTRLRRFFCCGT